MKHIEIWVNAYNPKYMTTTTVAYYDESSADLAEILKDLAANGYGITGIEYAKKGTVDVFVITVE